MHKIGLDKLDGYLSGRTYVLMIGLGFDQRSLCSLQSIDQSSPIKVFGILNPVRKGMPQTNYHDEFFAKAKSNSEVIGLDSFSLIETIDLIQEKLRGPELENADIVLDITALSHEVLTAMIGLLANESLLEKTTILYTSATEYGNTADDSPNWLSKGVSDIRSVLGFPGLMLPSKKILLIIMAGFETERASEVISRYEPAKLAIGYGSKAGSLAVKHHELNKMRAGSIVDEILFNNIVDYQPDSFEFSCTDPMETKYSILDYIANAGSYNIIICPLNNKISTVGAALAALELPSIQICYAQPQEYNMAGYAHPSSEVTIYKFS